MQWAGAKVINEQMQLKSHERGDPQPQYVAYIALKIVESYHDGQQLQKDMALGHTPLLP
jgi:hypothetical protein